MTMKFYRLRQVS